MKRLFQFVGSYAPQLFEIKPLRLSADQSPHRTEPLPLVITAIVEISLDDHRQRIGQSGLAKGTVFHADRASAVLYHHAAPPLWRKHHGCVKYIFTPQFAPLSITCSFSPPAWYSPSCYF